MSVASAPNAPGARSPWLTASGWRGLFRDRPTIPLLVLLVVLVILSELVRPGIVNLNWGGVMLRTAVPLAILAGCQVLTMLTGGIDLSVGAVASMSGFLVATLVGDYGLVVALLVAMGIAAIAGLLTGIGVGVFRVHPLIMTLGMGLVVFGFANAWQLIMVQTGGGTPAELRWIGSGSLFGIVPHSLLVFVPLAALILFSLRRTGYGRLLYAIGDNPIAARLSGARSWQVLLVLYAISAVHGVDRRVPAVGPHERRQRDPRRLVRAAVRRGRGHRRDVDHGWPGRVRRGDRGGADPRRDLVPPVVPRLPRGGPPDPVRIDHRRRRGRVHQGHGGVLSGRRRRERQR